MILSGDIGGTHARIGLFAELPEASTRAAGRAPGGFRAVGGEVFDSREHRDLEEILRAFLSRHRGVRIARACFGIAGAVKDGRCEATNLPWVVDARELARELRLPSVGLINDLEANAWGIGVLAPSELAVLSAGVASPTSNGAVISAGTGLGEAGLYWDGQGHRPFASEGGHADFAPRTELELELLRWLQKQFGRVSYERVVSGPGLINVYQFLRGRRPKAEPKWLAEELRAGDPAVAISRHALQADNPLCEQALEVFVEVYGAEAGNLALKLMATAGVYLGGGIAPKILPLLQDGRFREAFFAKGRLRPLLEAIPISVVLNDQAALLGGARWTTMHQAGPRVRGLPKPRERGLPSSKATAGAKRKARHTVARR